MSFEFYICWKRSSLTKKKLMLNTSTIIIISVLHVMWHGGKKKSNNCQNNLRSRPQSAFPIQCSKCIIDVKTSEEDQDGRPTNSKMLYVEVANLFLLHTEGRNNTGCSIWKWKKNVGLERSIFDLIFGQAKMRLIVSYLIVFCSQFLKESNEFRTHLVLQMEHPVLGFRNTWLWQLDSNTLQVLLFSSSNS